MKGKYLTIICCLVVALITCFIFYNSSKGYEESYKDSDTVTEIVKPIVSDKITEDADHFDFLIRKSAHVLEFLCLGIGVTLLLISIKHFFSKAFFGFGLFYVLAVAVADEYVQTYTGRTSSVEDVVLDFAGGLIGFLISFGIFKLIILIKRKIKPYAV